MIAAISWRNIWRNKWRSAVIILAITAGLTGGIFTVAMYNGMTEQKLRTAVDTQTAHLQVHAPRFQQNKDIRLFLESPNVIISELENESFVSAVSRRLVAMGMAASSNANTGVLLNGIHPDKERMISTIYQSMVAGDYFETEKRNQILLSSRTARKLKVEVNGKVVITLQDINGDIVGAAFRVTGIFRTTHSMFDESNVFVRKQDLERILSIDGVVNEIAVRLDDIENVPAVQQRLRAKFSAEVADIQSWRDIQPELAYINDASWQMNYLVLIIILLALAFGILNTMLMAIFERVKEIGVLMAVGMSKYRIFMMIILETIFLSLTGAALGMIVSAIIVFWTNRSGINLSMFAQGLESFGISSIIYPALEPQFYGRLAAMVIVAAMLSALYPAIKALRLKPVEAIHG
ncbi:MAG TPA: FtsX-like permease family protein [Chryseosolibacter sp.]|nr:FtsX-like permease family protein [Chryseosolibacter sp.]